MTYEIFPTKHFHARGNLTTGGLVSFNTGWQPVSVPEPTSGLLMLLGLAGLALRRRRAASHVLCCRVKHGNETASNTGMKSRQTRELPLARPR